MLENIIGGYEVKKGMLVALVVLGLVMGICLSGLAGASTTYTKQVIPLVNVDSVGSLGIVSGASGENNNLIDFDHLRPGTTTTKTLGLNVSANDNWRITVSRSQNLTYDATNGVIPSTSFTFTSNGTEGPTYATSNTEFGTVASPADVVTNGSAISDCNVNVVYRLIIPANQPTGYYTAAHTYTLIVGSP